MMTVEKRRERSNEWLTTNGESMYCDDKLVSVYAADIHHITFHLSRQLETVTYR